MSDRKQMVYDLIENELEWMHSNFDKHSLAQVAEFFANGGFSSWTDEEIEKKHKLFIKEESKSERD